MIPLPTFTTNIFNINILKKEHVDCTGDVAPDRLTFDVYNGTEEEEPGRIRIGDMGRGGGGGLSSTEEVRG